MPPERSPTTLRPPGGAGYRAGDGHLARMSATQDDAVARERLDGLDLLRGLASLAVCWFHLTSFTYG
jgi:hypothetical protein